VSTELSLPSVELRRDYPNHLSAAKQEAQKVEKDYNFLDRVSQAIADIGELPPWPDHKGSRPHKRGFLGWLVFGLDKWRQEQLTGEGQSL
jgi:hypothetical protein